MLGLSDCQTTAPCVPATQVAGEPPAADELADSQVRGLIYRECRACGQDGSAMQVRMRLSGNNYVVRIAYSPVAGKRFDPSALYEIRPVWNRNFIPRFRFDHVTFADAERVTREDGRTYWVTDWLWNAIH